MIKVYGLEACADCQDIKEQIKGRENEYTYFDLAKDTKLMKEFLFLRDHNEAFAKVREKGTIGIPYYVLEDGTVTLYADKAGLVYHKRANSCSLEDHKNGVAGC